jgi:membrane-associated phospholipid phosphatase
MGNIHSLKFFLYDWAGYNKIISEHIHSSITSRSLIAFFRSVTQIGNFYFFPIVFGLLLMALFVLLKKNKKNALPQGVSYIRCLILLFLNLTAAALVIGCMKELFHYHRPYCVAVFDMSNYMLSAFSYPQKSCLHSFPSAHTAYICLLVVSFWRIFNKNLKIAGTFLIILVGISRVILGKHFIADVTYAFAIALFVINPLSNFLITKYFSKIESGTKKLLKKII